MEHPEGELGLRSCEGPNPVTLGRSLALLGFLRPQNMQDSGLLCGWLLLVAPQGRPHGQDGERGALRGCWVFTGGLENSHLVMEPAQLGWPCILGWARRARCLSSFFFKSSLDKDGQ